MIIQNNIVCGEIAMKHCIYSIPKHRQTGVVLITAMLLLLVMTIIGISASSTGVVEEKMASNVRQGEMALQAAEIALRNGEDLFAVGFGSAYTKLTANTLSDIFNGSTSAYPGLYSRLTRSGVGAIAEDLVPFDTNDPSAWDSTNSIQGQGITGLSIPPRYIIEFVGKSEDSTPEPGGIANGYYSFRITAIGFGQEANVSRVLSSVYRLRL